MTATFNTFKIRIPYKLANLFCLRSFNRGGVASFLKHDLYFTFIELSEPADKDFKVKGVKIQVKKSHSHLIGWYRSPNSMASCYFQISSKLWLTKPEIPPISQSWRPLALVF